MHRNLMASFSGSLKSAYYGSFQFFKYDISSASLKFLWHRFSTSFKLSERSDYWMRRF
uniref:Uncharacterized protein n=1 Tax=Rhizophagus irregularis (strain DAOM 181602 / DAOM 197198 / MUCL 43194) TaxID=747089 RepID=U9USD0_RHIID